MREEYIDATCHQIVRAMLAMEPALTDWQGYIELLAANEDANEVVEVRFSHIFARTHIASLSRLSEDCLATRIAVVLTIAISPPWVAGFTFGTPPYVCCRRSESHIRAMQHARSL